MRIHPLSLLAVLLVAACAASLPHSADARPSDASVAAEASADATRFASWLRHGAPDPDDPQAARDALRLVDALAEEAYARGLDRAPHTRIALAQIENQIARTLLKQDVQRAIAIDDDAVEAQYRATRDRYGLPRRVRLRNLFLAFPPDGDDSGEDAARDAVWQRMRTLRDRARDGADFAALAEAHSDSTTWVRGGLMGNVRPGQLSPDLDRLIATMTPGAVSEILRSDDGLTLLYCESVLPAVVRTEAEKRDYARELLRTQAFKTAWRDLNAALQQQIAPTYHPAPTAADDDAATFVENGGEAWTRAEIAALLADRSDAPLPQTLGADHQRQLEAFLAGRAGVRRLAARELTDDPAYAEGWPWQRRKQLATAATAARVAARMVPLTDDDLRRFIAAQPDAFMEPPRVRLAVLQLPGVDQAPASQRTLWALRQRIASGALRFEDAARSTSLHPSAARGGVLAPMTRRAVSSRLGIDVTQAVARLEVGEISRAIDDGSALWLIQLRAIEPARPMSFDEARPRAEQRLGQERTDALRTEVLDAFWAQLTAAQDDAREDNDPTEDEP
ncbi:MAG: peptidyl-prolyl cis-trans isomerase [Acidobacteriota bacterium]